LEAQLIENLQRRDVHRPPTQPPRAKPTARITAILKSTCPAL
jgi:hypothetical protein